MPKTFFNRVVVTPQPILFKGYYKRWVKSQDSACNTNEISGMTLKKTTLLFVVLGGGIILSFLLLVTEILNRKQATNCLRWSQ